MTTLSTPSSNFVRRVRAEMASQELSVRALARRMDPANLNRARRNLHRWLDGGITPGRASRVAVAEALGLPEGELDDEEDEAAMREAFLLFVDLMGQVNQAQKKNARKRAMRA